MVVSKGKLALVVGHNSEKHAGGYPDQQKILHLKTVAVVADKKLKLQMTLTSDRNDMLNVEKPECDNNIWLQCLILQSAKHFRTK